MESNKYKVKILPQAESDLKEIFDYIVNQLFNLTAGEKLMSEIMASIEIASNFPYSMPIFRNARVTEKEYRRIIVGNYALIYKIDDGKKEIRIMTVFYAPSNQAELFGSDIEDE